MNEDTRKRIGTVLDETAQRDAVHIAVVPLTAGEDLEPGEEFVLAYGTKDVALAGETAYGNKTLGIVDPFLKGWQVKKGQRFYGFIFPGTVTGMRHHYFHPDLDGPEVKPANEHEDWLRRFAEKWNFDYDEMVAAAQHKDGYVVARGKDLHDARDLDPGDEGLFWQHMAALTGKPLAQYRKTFQWSCSC